MKRDYDWSGLDYREFFKDGLMKVTCTVDDITTVRSYKRV